MKFKNVIITTIIIFLKITSSAQIIDVTQKTLEELKVFETSNNGICTDSIASFGIQSTPLTGPETLIQTKVLIYKRSDDTFDPMLHVWYHFEQDSIKTKAITYNWGLYNPSFNPRKEEDRLRDYSKREQDFVNKYNSLKTELQEKLGDPSKIKTLSDDEVNFRENIVWEDDEKVVKLTIKFSRTLRQMIGIGLQGDYEVSVLITYR